MFEQHLGRSVTIDQAASLLHVSRRTIYNRIRDGKLQTIRTIGGSQRVLVTSLDDNRRSSWTGIKVAEHPWRKIPGIVTTVSKECAWRLLKKACGDHRLLRWLWSSPPPHRSARRRVSRHSLKKHVASKSAQAVDVIVHGSPDEIRAIAARHGLRIKKTLLEGAVLQTSAAGIEALAADVDHLSRDIDVTSFMSVSNAATGADQVQAGLEGVSRFTGAGVGIALLDSGVWTGHRSLAGRVVYSKDFVGDEAIVRGKGPRT